ncbi:MAG TPA: rod shape-determining protein MreC [Ruminococcaceae bacterium]|nr:rod shape-determining protein MreC [Oscillospiraceae bacterium]
MRFFFRTRQFKIILAIFLIVTITSLTFGIVAHRMSPFSDAAGVVSAPFKNAYNAVANGIKDIYTAYKNGNDLMIRNSEQEKEINELRKKVADYENTKNQNEFYSKYLEIKEKNNDFKFAPATLISRDKSDKFKSFVINKGSISGISLHDPVITDAGLVGYITEVGTTTSKVTTILSPNVSLGALDSRTSDSGVITGDYGLAEKGQCRLINISRTSGVALGDYIITSGEGVFPDGLMVGSISNIGTNPVNSSIYADIKPLVDFSDIRNVMVITSFEGQGDIIKKGD